MSKCGKNYRTVGGRCVRKSYSPFRMWGSYLGIVFYILMFAVLNIFSPKPLLVGSTYYATSQFLLGFPGYLFFHANSVNMMPDFATGISILLTNVIFWFLLGWIIHSIIRKLRR